MVKRKRLGSYEILIKVSDYIAGLDLDDFHSIREVSIELGLTWRSTRDALKTLTRIGLALDEGEKNKKYGRSWI